MVRQIADEADGVRQQDSAPVRQAPLPGARVERREELVLDIDRRAGELVHQRALAGVGVTDERDRVLLITALDLALLARLYVAEAFLEVADFQADEAAV